MSTRDLLAGGPIELFVDAASRQSRLSIAFRFVLLIPQLVFGFFVGIGAGAILVVAWFGALITGQLPQWAADFLGGYLRWSARFAAYEWLLTDHYPPFTIDDDPNYPVQVAISPGRLNRWTVLFRGVILIPATIITPAAMFGLQVVSVVMWVIVLISGRMPKSLGQAVIAIVRYQLRYTGFSLMLSSTYPYGLLGDRQRFVVPPAPRPPTPLAQPDSDPRSQWWDTPRTGPFGAPPGPPHGPPSPISPLPFAEPAISDPTCWRLVLGSAARGLVVLFLIVGTVGYAGDIALNVINFRSVWARTSADFAVTQLDQSYSMLERQSQQFTAAEGACQRGSTPVSCLQPDEAVLSRDFNDLAGSVFALSVPASAFQAQAALSSTAERASTELMTLSQEPNTAAYAASPALQSLERDAPLVDVQYRQLVAAIQVGA